MIPASVVFDQSTIVAMLEHDPVVFDYRAFFSVFDWSHGEQWEAQRSAYCGSHGHPISTYSEAFLIRMREGMIYFTQLRRFLLKHPLLIIELGFNLELDPNATDGFDAQKTLPCRYWLGEKLRTLDQDLLQPLLHATVTTLWLSHSTLPLSVAFA